MTLNDLSAKFKIIDSFNAAKDEIQLSNDSDRPTLCTVAGCIIYTRPTYLCNSALTYLFTYLHSWFGEYKTGDISETVEDRAKVSKLLLTAYPCTRL